jgi:transcriptional regulator with XRE-family HTH domain
MEQNWMAVADALRASRVSQGLTQADLAQKAKISRVAVQALERGRARARMSPALLAVTQVLGWPDGYVNQVLAGEAEGPPRAIDAPQARGGEGLPPDLPLAVTHELKQGALIDSRVVHLGDDSGARMIVVLKGDVDMTPEQIERALKEWRRVARQMTIGETHEG